MDGSSRVTALIEACLLAVAIMCGLQPAATAAGEAKAMGEGRTEREAVTIVTVADNGKGITLARGGVLEIELQTIGAAGYSWEFDNLDSQYLEMISRGSRALSERMGAPVLNVWRLRAVKSGSTKIVMYNYRVWEGKENSVNKFTIDVRIE